MDAATIAIGSRIKLAREQKGISQEELAALISKRQFAVSEYETGKRKIFANDLAQIAKVLGVSGAFFFDEDSVAQEEMLLSEYRSLPNEEARKFAIRLLSELREFTERLK